MQYICIYAMILQTLMWHRCELSSSYHTGWVTQGSSPSTCYIIDTQSPTSQMFDTQSPYSTFVTPISYIPHFVIQNLPYSTFLTPSLPYPTFLTHTQSLIFLICFVVVVVVVVVLNQAYYVPKIVFVV